MRKKAVAAVADVTSRVVRRCRAREPRAFHSLPPFASALEHLEACFAALGTLDPAMAFSGSWEELDVAAERTLTAGVSLPFEEFARREELDRTDRVLLLTLLRDALDPRSKGGIPLAHLFAAARAERLSEQEDVRYRIERHGSLRRLALVECDLDARPEERLYRLARRFRDPLVGGMASESPMSEPQPAKYSVLLGDISSEVDAILTDGAPSRWARPTPTAGAGA